MLNSINQNPPKTWYALYTRSRHEKLIDDQLRARQIESFLPIRRIKRRWSDRTVTVDEPLFKSYLFVKTERSRASEVLMAKGAVNFVSSQGHFIPVEENVILTLKELMDHEIAVDPFPYLAVGDKVYVRSGVFKGVEGFVARKDSAKCRVVISISAIRASIAVEVDAELVERV